jgi:hypothetical protein
VDPTPPTPPADPTPPAPPVDPTPPSTPANPGSPPSSAATPAAAVAPAKSSVLGDTAASGSARLAGPSACVRGAFTVSVRGSRIRQVAFSVDGSKRGTVKAKSGRTLFSLRIDPRRASFGVHRVSAVVGFTAASQTSARTLRLVYQRCPRSAVKPQFTG